MHIALDATYSISAQPTGVGVYSGELIAGVAVELAPETVGLCYRPHRFLRSFREAIPRNCRRRPLIDSLRLPGVRLFHGLNQRLPAARYHRTVCTFHDLFVMTAEYSTVEFRQRFTAFARSAAERSDLIIAISSFTASQVTELLGVEPSRIRVVPHGVRIPAEISHHEREKIILHVGSIQKRKNVSRLLRAFEGVPAPWRLVLAGATGFGAAEIGDQISTSPARDRVEVRGYVSAEDLQRLYARASVFAFPSLDEGFGMPVLEAMARGIPVLTSSRSALPEVGGDAVLYANPESVESIAERLLELVQDSGLRSELVARGRQRAATFSWESAARKTAAVYRELLS